jgi:hypothetical protein
MEALRVETTPDKYIIEIDRKTMSQDAFNRMLERLEIEALIQEVAFGDSTLNLGTEMKRDWWQRNRQRLGFDQ